MNGAILKLQYKKAGQDDLSGMIIGSFFFANKNTIATCNHVLKKNNIAPEKPFNNCVHYFLFGNTAIRLADEMLSEKPEIDLTLVHLKKSYEVDTPVFSRTFTPINLVVESESYDTTNASFIDIGWENEIPIIKSFDLGKITLKKSGYVTDRTEENFEKEIAQGIQLKNAKCLVVSYGGKAGSSGSPLYSTKTKELLGMIWGGEKEGSTSVKQFRAISSLEILAFMKTVGSTKPFWKFW